MTEKMGQLFSYSETERTVLPTLRMTVEASFGWLDLEYLRTDPALSEDAKAMYTRAAKASRPVHHKKEVKP